MLLCMYQLLSKLVSYSKQPEPNEITLFQTKEWKGDTQPQLSPLLSMMGEVQKIQQEQNRPCVVMCKLVDNLEKINYHI